MRTIFVLFVIVGCSSLPPVEDEFMDSDYKCLLAESDNDRKTVCVLKE